MPLCRLFMRLLYTMVYAGFMPCAHRLALCQYDASGGSTMHIRIRINKAACRHKLPKCANVIIAILGAAGGLPPSRSPPAARPWAEEGWQRRKEEVGRGASPPPRLHDPPASPNPLRRCRAQNSIGSQATPSRDPGLQSALCGLMFLLCTGLCGCTWGSLLPRSLGGWPAVSLFCF